MILTYIIIFIISIFFIMTSILNCCKIGKKENICNYDYIENNEDLKK